VNVKPLIMVAAGGTGGHLFPAQALALELRQRGFRVELVSDHRVQKFAEGFPADAVHQVAAGTVTGSGVVNKLKGAVALGRGILACRGLLKDRAPAAVVGFGGYPTVPPLYAATMLKIPTIIHEGNAVMGRANTMLAKGVSRVASNFPLGGNATRVGYPVRDTVIAAAATPYPVVTPNGMLNLLVFGGSQGARIMGEIVPPAVALLSADQRARLSITQQVRDEDMARVRAEYSRLSVAIECNPFFRDLPARMAQSHLIIGRAGASTVAELSVIGRPALLVPLPGALDQDQAANAKVLADAGGAEIMLQPDGFTPEKLGARLAAFLASPTTLTDMAAKARAIGISDAAAKLADVVVEVAGLGKAA
jgi:UDP-N-acetylglucosamine--N-acetylmuramyl-(pentapeptide) pyrophosphoryl-undecaprenol N-acetylglucosamine transferase